MLPPLQDPAFETAGLKVFEICALQNDLRGNVAPRRMFVATLRTDNWPGIVATACICPGENNYIDWAEVIERYREYGIKRELFAGIEAYIGAPLKDGEYFTRFDGPLRLPVMGGPQ